MQETLVQPGATPIPEPLVAELLRNAVDPGLESSFTLANHGHFSNDVAEARLPDGRTMMIKRGRYPWSAARFRSSRIAADLLREEGIETPRTLPVDPQLREACLDVYWRIELPTLAELWPDLEPAERREAMWSLGRLVRRAHRVRFAGQGEVRAAMEREVSLSALLADDLGGRLMPPVMAEWPGGLPLIEALLEMIPDVARRAPAQGVLLHGDLHMANILCERGPGTVRCAGLIDLESAHAGPRESDLARLWIMHTELFGMAIPEPWFEWVLEGYRATLDPAVLRFYAGYHLADLGLHSAVVGHHEHAAAVAAAGLATISARVPTPSPPAAPAPAPPPR